MRRMGALGKNIALLAIALIVSLGACELVVRNFVSVRDVGPAFTIYDPFYGQSLKKSFSTRRIAPEFTMTFTTNVERLRGPELGFLSRRPILFLGDSFTMGYGVNDGEEFPALVRKALDTGGPDTIPVINAGVGNNGNGRWVKFLRTEGKKYNPSLVVLQVLANDFQDNVHERLFEVAPTGDLRELSTPQGGAQRIVQGLIESIPGLAHSYLVGLVRQVLGSEVSVRSNADSKISLITHDQALLEEQLLFRLLEEVLSLCKKEGWPVLVIVPDDTASTQLMHLKNFLSIRDISTIVIPGKIESPDLYYKVDGHWNASGHKFAADQVLQKIAKPDLKYW